MTYRKCKFLNDRPGRPSSQNPKRHQCPSDGNRAPDESALKQVGEEPLRYNERLENQCSKVKSIPEYVTNPEKDADDVAVVAERWVDVPL